MTTAGFREVLISPHSVSWVRDREQVIILDGQYQEMFVLRGIEIAIWGWLILTYPYEKIVQSLTVMLGISAEDSEQRLWLIFQKWISAGILDLEAR